MRGETGGAILQAAMAEPGGAASTPMITPRSSSGSPGRQGPARVLSSVLGPLSAREFMRRFWQKEALLLRSALPGFTGALDRADLFALALREDVESRLVRRDGARWSVVRGPLTRSALRALPARNWTLLVQGVNLHVPDVDALLRRFAFLPYARLDDVMVSYAAPGGGVGPHIDAYDVFLLQGFGRRRWRYGRQDERAFRPGLPLRILQRFAPAHDAVLAPGDMLYLPPHHAHDGVALDACTTYSIGFRAPSATELARAFLDFLHERLDVPGEYHDPDLVPTRDPARIDGRMQRRIERLLRGIHWTRDDIVAFVGAWLTEPKPTVFFEPPRAPLTRARFVARSKRVGVRLNARSQVLYDDSRLFVNGEVLARIADDGAVVEFANRRTLSPRHVASAKPHELSLFYEWYRNGYLEFIERDR